MEPVESLQRSPSKRVLLVRRKGFLQGRNHVVRRGVKDLKGVRSQIRLLISYGAFCSGLTVSAPNLVQYVN